MQRTRSSTYSALVVMAMMSCFGTVDVRRQKLIQIDDIADTVHKGNTQPRRLRSSKTGKKQLDLMTVKDTNQKVEEINLDLEEMFDETELDFRVGFGSMSTVRDNLTTEYSKYISRWIVNANHTIYLSFFFRILGSNFQPDRRFLASRLAPPFPTSQHSPQFLDNLPSHLFLDNRLSPPSQDSRPSPRFLASQHWPQFLVSQHLLQFLDSRPSPRSLDSLPSHQFLTSLPLPQSLRPQLAPPKLRLLLLLSPDPRILRQHQHTLLPRCHLAILRKSRLYRRRLFPAISHPTSLLKSLRRLHLATHQRSLHPNQRVSPASSQHRFLRHPLDLPLLEKRMRLPQFLPLRRRTSQRQVLPRLLLRLSPHPTLLRQHQLIFPLRCRLAILRIHRKFRHYRRRLFPAISHPTSLLKSLRRIHRAILRKSRLYRRRLFPAISHPTSLLKSLRRLHLAILRKSRLYRRRLFPAISHPTSLLKFLPPCRLAILRKSRL
jgi:hypothetical protein